MNRHRACDDFHHASETTRRTYATGGGLTRRQALLRGLGGAVSLYAAQALGPFERVLEAAQAQAAAAPNAPVLVSVFLPGGVDLLDAVPPLDRYGRYADLRGGMRLEGAPALGRTGLGIHPALADGANGGVKGLFEAGKVALLPGIDYANPDLSHFHSRHFWETGLITNRESTGWVGRWLDATGSAENPLQGISLSWSLSPLLRSSRAPVAAVSSPESAQLWLPGVWGDAESIAMSTWAELCRARAGAGPGARAALEKSWLMKDVADRLAPYKEEDGVDPLAGSVAYPDDNELAERLRVAAGLISAPLGVRALALEADGDFDTHDNQPGELERGLRDVSRALAAFQADLEARGVADRVLTLVWSEFGRRPEGNDSSGTDHGAGGLAWVQGTRVRGGVQSEYPDLGRLDRHGNLAVTVDFRRVYASLLEQWLGTDGDQVIPSSRSFGRVGLVA